MTTKLEKLVRDEAERMENKSERPVITTVPAKVKRDAINRIWERLAAMEDF